jgi:putative transcriptional regulator
MAQGLAVVGALASCICAAALSGHGGQYRMPEDLSTGRILLANEKLTDPNFRESVILIVQYDSDDGTLGLVLNRRSDVPLARVFPDIKGAKTDRVYLGGPVGTTMAQALLRLPGKTDRASHVAGDVYATGSKELIEKSVASHAEPSKFRLYLGYAGWAPGQLEAELKAGAWSVINGGPSIVFDEHPDSLWPRLIRESHMQIAKLTGRVSFARAISGKSAQKRLFSAGTLELADVEVMHAGACENSGLAKVADGENAL